MTDGSTPSQAGPRVVIADDQTLVRTGFRMILRDAGIPVVAEAADGAEAVAAVRAHDPDVVLMDIRMPEMDGLEATRRILAEQPGTDCRIIILTTFDLDQYVYGALAAGASGFLLKHVLARVPHRCYQNGALRRRPARPLDHRACSLERFALHSSQPALMRRELSHLTPRELDVLRLLARGLSNAELAAQLTLSEATVKTHVARLLAKLQLRDRVQAVVLAYETGLISPGRDSGGWLIVPSQGTCRQCPAERPVRDVGTLPSSQASCRFRNRRRGVASWPGVGTRRALVSPRAADPPGRLRSLAPRRSRGSLQVVCTTAYTHLHCHTW